jgi:hypothetical protein
MQLYVSVGNDFALTDGVVLMIVYNTQVNNKRRIILVHYYRW